MRENTNIRVYDKKKGLVYLSYYSIKEKIVDKKNEVKKYVVGRNESNISVRGYEWDECINVKDTDNMPIYENDIVAILIKDRIITGIVEFCLPTASYILSAGDLALPAYFLRQGKIVGNRHEDNCETDDIAIKEMKDLDLNCLYCVPKEVMESNAAAHEPAARDTAAHKSERVDDETDSLGEIDYSQIEFATFYTDGGCESNPNGPGGYGVVLVEDNKIVKELSGGDKCTTNNRMELTAIISALRFMDEHGIKGAEIISDSKYCIDGKTKWMSNWIKNDWKASSGDVKNVDLWKQVNALCENKTVRFKWVKGHDGNEFNERCDRLATIEIMRAKDKSK